MIAMEPVETIHVYYERKELPQPPKPYAIVWVISFSAFAIGFLIGASIMGKPPFETIIVPAHFLPVKYFSVAEKIILTGMKTYPATTAHGIITITNGSILSGDLPKGMIVTGRDSIEVVTDTAVFIPAGSASGYGVVTVSAHAMLSGKNGNIPAYDIDSVVSTSIYIRNLASFTGGNQAYSITYTKLQDRLKALSRARDILSWLFPQKMLISPCRESMKGSLVIWACQYITYTPPVFFRIVGVEVRGKYIILYGYSVGSPGRIWVK